MSLLKGEYIRGQSTLVDGVLFEDERVVFVEFKMGTSKLTQRQRRIRDLVRAGRVEFKELRLE